MNLLFLPLFALTRTGSIVVAINEEEENTGLQLILWMWIAQCTTRKLFLKFKLNEIYCKSFWNRKKNIWHIFYIVKVHCTSILYRDCAHSGFIHQLFFVVFHSLFQHKMLFMNLKWIAVEYFDIFCSCFGENDCKLFTPTTIITATVVSNKQKLKMFQRLAQNCTFRTNRYSEMEIVLISFKCVFWPD